jgi:hypothetical protein
MSECIILLEAKYPARNIFRSYYISAFYDLFDRLIIELIHGRIGSKGKSTMFHMENKEEAIAFIATKLKQRETSVKRIGVPYILKYYASHWDMDEILFPFRQIQLFDNLPPIPDKKTSAAKEIIKEGEGLFG